MPVGANRRPRKLSSARKLPGERIEVLRASRTVPAVGFAAGEMEAVMTQIGRLGTPHRIHALATGQVMRLG